MERGAILRDIAIVVEGTRIARIDSNVSAATYDLRGVTVMPGWIDTHTHIATHFDRETDRVHSPQVKETPQQAMLYAVENADKTFMAGLTNAPRSLSWSKRQFRMSVPQSASSHVRGPHRARVVAEDERVDQGREIHRGRRVDRDDVAFVTGQKMTDRFREA